MYKNQFQNYIVIAVGLYNKGKLYDKIIKLSKSIKNMKEAIEKNKIAKTTVLREYFPTIENLAFGRRRRSRSRSRRHRSRRHRRHKRSRKNSLKK